MNEYQDLEQALNVFVGKWKPIIIYHLTNDGTKRYSDLQRSIPEITKRMLTLKLRELEESGIVSRKVYNQVPPKVEYSMTEYGLTLHPLLVKMNDWGEGHRRPEDHLEQAEHTNQACKALTTIDTIIGKWKSIIISELASENLRFSDLQKRIPQISRTMLTNNLKQLENEGIVHREVHQQVPPKVVYSMTDYGATLKPILQDLNQWGEEFIKRQNEGI